MRQVAKDEGVLIFFIIVPLVYPVLYSWIYNNEVVRDVPVCVVDDTDGHVAHYLIIIYPRVEQRIDQGHQDKEDEYALVLEGPLHLLAPDVAGVLHVLI